MAVSSSLFYKIDTVFFNHRSALWVDTEQCLQCCSALNKLCWCCMSVSVHSGEKILQPLLRTSTGSETKFIRQKGLAYVLYLLFLCCPCVYVWYCLFCNCITPEGENYLSDGLADLHLYLLFCDLQLLWLVCRYSKNSEKSKILRNFFNSSSLISNKYLRV